jgi:hypothetical protein
MSIPSAQAAFLADMREWARDPQALVYTVRGKHGMVAIAPEDVTSKTDEELMAFIAMRCRESPRTSASGDVA